MERNFENFSTKRGGQRAEIWELQVTVFKIEHTYGRLSKKGMCRNARSGMELG